MMTGKMQRAAAIDGGTFVAVVGPSGAGKDAVMGYARDRLRDDPRFHFVRRVITRPCDGKSEIHDSMEVAEFHAAEAAGRFALSWRAHGLCYGLPATVDALIAAGRTVVANTSRGSIDALRELYRRVEVVEITAPPQVLAARIAARGREGGDDLRRRLASRPAAGGRVVDNSGPLEEAGEQLVDLLRATLAPEK